MHTVPSTSQEQAPPARPRAGCRRRPPPPPPAPPPASDEELARTLTRLGYEPSDDQVADRLVAELLRRPAGEGGRPHPTWKRQLPGLRALAGELVGAARAGHHVSQATLAQQTGLRRPGRVRVDGPAVAPDDRGRRTVNRTILAWEAMGLVAYLDDGGRRLERFDHEGLPLPRGSNFAKGSTPLYWVDVSWSPEMVAQAPAAVRRRAAWAWAALRAGAADQLVAAMLGDPCRGEARLQAWWAWHELDERRRRRREQRAVRQAVARADQEQERALCPDPLSAGEWELIRGVVGSEEARQSAERDPHAAAHLERAVRMLAEHDAEVQAAALSLDRVGDLVEGELPTPLPEPDPASQLVPTEPLGLAGPAPSKAPPRETRMVGPLPDDPRWIDLDRTDLTDRLLETITEGRILRAEFYIAAGQLGERRPDLAWRQARNVARRCQVRLAAVVGEYVRAGDQTLADIPVRVQAELRKPVECPATFAWGITRRALGLDRGPTRAAGRPGPPSSGTGPSEVAPADQVEVSGRLPVYEPPPPPERSMSTEEMAAIRARAAAQHRAATSSDLGGGEPAAEGSPDAPRRTWTQAELRAIRDRAQAAYQATREART